jgi:hypothetical protein
VREVGTLQYYTTLPYYRGGTVKRHEGALRPKLKLGTPIWMMPPVEEEDGDDGSILMYIFLEVTLM